MFLVDTSVWISYLRGVPTEPVKKFEALLAEGHSFGITSAIYQEVLQGADSEVSFARLDRYLRTQLFYHPLDPIESYTEAARIYSRCRRAGITIRSTLDCLIARVAIEHELILVHSDGDFENMARVVPELRLL